MAQLSIWDHQGMEENTTMQSPLTEISSAIDQLQGASDTGVHSSADSTVREANAHEAIDNYTLGLRNFVDLYFGMFH
jgi:hypothetical protein